MCKLILEKNYTCFSQIYLISIKLKIEINIKILNLLYVISPHHSFIETPPSGCDNQIEIKERENYIL